MSRLSLVAVTALVTLAGACGIDSTTPTPPTSPSATPSTTSSATSTPTGVVSSETDGPDVFDYRVTYGFAVPTAAAVTEHGLTAPSQAQLVGMNAGDHPSDSPAYQRMSFYFRNGFPDYSVQYVPEVISDGRGDVVALPGSAFLRVDFTNAVAHTEAGSSSVTSAPPTTLGYSRLLGYAPAGDFEGRVSFGLGLSSQVQVRTGELRRGSGASAEYVVFVDIRSA